MVVSEKNLLSVMKSAYKAYGYKVAVSDRGGQEDVLISAESWTVVIRKGKLPRKVLGLIAEHVGEIPVVGEAYQVKVKETQTEIFDVAWNQLMEFHSGERERRIIRRTNLVWGGYPIWQATTDRKIVKLDPEYERIMLWDSQLVRLIGTDLLMIDDDDSRAYIRCVTRKPDEQAMYEHLESVPLTLA